MSRERVRSTSKRKNKNRTRKIRILLVDDHPSVLNGVRSYLRSREGYVVVGQALDGVEAVMKANELQPDIVILDLSLPQMSGLEALRRINGDVPAAMLIAYTMHDGKEFVREALRAGANGYVRKTSSLRVLVRAIVGVRCGEMFVDSTISRLEPTNWDDHKQTGCESETGAERKSPRNDLTRREKQVLKELVDGKVIKQIADDLSVAFNTATHHVMHIYQKLHVNTRGAAVAKAFRDKLV